MKYLFKFSEHVNHQFIFDETSSEKITTTDESPEISVENINYELQKIQINLALGQLSKEDQDAFNNVLKEIPKGCPMELKTIGDGTLIIIFPETNTKNIQAPMQCTFMILSPSIDNLNQKIFQSITTNIYHTNLAEDRVDGGDDRDFKRTKSDIPHWIKTLEVSPQKKLDLKKFNTFLEIFWKNNPGLNEGLIKQDMIPNIEKINCELLLHGIDSEGIQDKEYFYWLETTSKTPEGKVNGIIYYIAADLNKAAEHLFFIDDTQPVENFSLEEITIEKLDKALDSGQAPQLFPAFPK